MAADWIEARTAMGEIGRGGQRLADVMQPSDPKTMVSVQVPPTSVATR